MVPFDKISFEAKHIRACFKNSLCLYIYKKRTCDAFFFSKVKIMFNISKWLTSDGRSVYLITYSQAHCQKIKSREDFAELFVRALGEDIVKQ